MSVVEELRQNDPENTFICLQLRYETSDAALARALEQNPFVTRIRLNMEDTEEQQQRPGWNSLVRVIATRANLEKVILAERSGTPPAWFARSCKRFNRTLPFEVWTCSGYDFPSIYLLLWTPHLQSHHLVFMAVTWKPPSRQQGARSLAAAIQRNTNIETLRLGSLEDIYAIPILEGLQSNTFFEDSYLFSYFCFYKQDFRCDFPCTSTPFGIHDLHYSDLSSVRHLSATSSCFARLLKAS